MASCGNPTGLLVNDSLRRCDSVSEDLPTGEGLLAILIISMEGVYNLTAEVVAAVVVPEVVVAAGVLTATPVKSRFVVVVVVTDGSKSKVSSDPAAMSLFDVNGMQLIGYG